MDSEVFKIDFDRFRMVDISTDIEPNQGDTSRPFLATRSDTLPDGKDTEIIHTHTHVGTHIETAKHFFRQGKTISDFPLERFMGRGCLLSIDDKEEDDLEMDKPYVKNKLEGIIQKEDIVIWRNDSTNSSTSTPHPEENLPYFTPGSSEYFIQKKVKMVIMGDVKFGKNIEMGSEFEGQLHSADIPILEIPDNLDKINRTRFYVIALPYKAIGLGSSWARAIILEKG